MNRHVRMLQWLWCMYRVRRTYVKAGILFSDRENFLKELQPRFYSDVGDEASLMPYPAAMMFVKPEDVDRALKVIGAPRQRTFARQR